MLCIVLLSRKQSINFPMTIYFSATINKNQNGKDVDTVNTFTEIRKWAETNGFRTTDHVTHRGNPQIRVYVANFGFVIEMRRNEQNMMYIHGLEKRENGLYQESYENSFNTQHNAIAMDWLEATIYLRKPNGRGEKPC